MKIGLIKITIASFALLALFAARAKAQETISPEKRALVAELLEVANSKKTAEEIMNTVLAEVEKGRSEMMTRMLEQEVKQRRLSEKEREELESYMNRTSARLNAKFKELFAQRINLGEIIEQISYPLYDKFFTEAELKDLVAFYKTETGRKAMKVMPELTGESMRRANDLMMPKIIALIDEIKEEESKEMDAVIKRKN